MSLSAAMSRVMQATSQMETGRTDDVEATLDAAVGFLVGLPAEEVASLLVEIAAIRAALADVVTPDERRMISAAEGKIRQANWQIEMRQSRDDIEGNLRGAEEFLDGIRRALAGPFVATIAEIRARLGGPVEEVPVEVVPVEVVPVEAVPVEAVPVDETAGRRSAGGEEPGQGEPVREAASELSDEDHRNISMARSRVMQARTQMETGRPDEVEPTLTVVEGLLATVPGAEKAPLLAQIAALRTELAGVVMPDERRMISAAEGKIRQANWQIEMRQSREDIEATLRGAEDFLDGLRDALSTPVLTTIGDIRAQLGAPVEAPPAAVQYKMVERVSGAREPDPVTPRAEAPTTVQPETEAGTPTAPPAPDQRDEITDEESRLVSIARGHLLSARSGIESRRTDGVGGALQEAATLLAGVRDAYKEQYLIQIDELRAALIAELHAEDVRRVTDEIDRHLKSAEYNLQVYPHLSHDALKLAAGRTGADDVARILSAEQIAAYRARFADITTRLAAHEKADAIQRATPILRELEQMLETDPFAGLEQHAAYVATRALQTLKSRVQHEIRNVPDGDVDVAAINARLLIADQTIDRASAAWGKAELDAQVGRGWDAIRGDIDGWADETANPDARPLEVPDMPRTRLAIARVRFFLADPETRRIRDENQDDPTLAATYREAEQVFEAAGAKLNAAYQLVLDAADTLEAPMSRSDLDGPTMFASAAGTSFGGTRYAEPLVTRAMALDARWRAEVAAIMKTRQELHDKLVVEADAAWPAIVESIDVSADFDPHDTDARGSVVLIEGVYNRSGWDFAGRDAAFSGWVDGVPIGGSYEPHVLAALEYAWYELKIDVSDRDPWSVVAVVEGPGKLGRRTTVVLRDSSTGAEIGKIEEWPPVDSIRLRIIALHAGPVAVGP